MKKFLQNKFNYIFIFLIFSIGLSLILKSKYRINDEFCWIDDNFKNTKRIGLSLKITDIKNDEIEYVFTHVMAHEAFQQLVGAYGLSKDSGSVDKFEILIKQNTLNKSACEEMYSRKEKINKLLNNNIRENK